LKIPEIPQSESTRLETLKTLNILDTPAEERFDQITRIAKKSFNVSMALVSLVDENRQWFKSSVGTDTCETSREISFCGHAIHSDEVFIVPDTLKDERFEDNPLVIGEHGIRFYAGYPVKAFNGEKLGTLCLIDNKPRDLTEEEIETLKDLGAVVERELSMVKIATMDDLTNIPNRRGFMIYAQHGLSYSTQHGYPATLVYFDIDNFKSINDEFGHHEGDKALITFAKQMKDTFRGSDVYGRIGGDEFVVLLGDSSKDQADLAVKNFKKIIKVYNTNAQNEYDISFSYGAVKYDPIKHDSVEAMMAECDSIMYGNKKLKNKVVSIYDARCNSSC